MSFFNPSIDDIAKSSNKIARCAYVNIKYNNKDITRDIAPYLLNFTFNDVATDKADDINITLEDRDKLWANDWFPNKGDTISCEIVVERWLNDTDNRSLPCGIFEIDEITASGLPSKIEIKATSVPNTGLKSEKRSKAWNATNLKQIAHDVTIRSKLKLFYDAPVISFERKDQYEQTDLAFLRGLCVEAGLAIKVNDNQIIIFEQLKYEQKETIMTINYEDVSNYSLTSKSSGIYSSAKLVYLASNKKKETNYTFEPQVIADMHKQTRSAKPQEKTLNEKNSENNKGKKRQLVIHTRASSKAEAERIAKNALRQANKSEFTGTLTLMGDPQLQACITVNLVNFGKFDGKYFVDSVKHDFANGYKSTAELHQCVNF